MQYQVPQFIEVEDKIFGPLTLRQFIYLAGGGGLCLLMFSLLPIYITIVLAMPVMAGAAALAFYQVNGRPLVVAVEHAFSYFTGSKLYLWKPRKMEAPVPNQVMPRELESVLNVPRLSESKLKDLSWSLNIKDRNRMGVKDDRPTGFEI
jgi:hypothetical protein